MSPAGRLLQCSNGIKTMCRLGKICFYLGILACAAYAIRIVLIALDFGPGDPGSIGAALNHAAGALLFGFLIRILAGWRFPERRREDHAR